MIKIYESKTGEPVIHTYDEDEHGAQSKARKVDPRLDLLNHSPTGCTWGYLGSGPAQTALAILCDYFRYIAVEAPEDAENRERNMTMLRLMPGGALEGPAWRDRARHEAEDLIDFIAIQMHQTFKADVIAIQSSLKPFRLTGADIDTWMRLCARGGS